MRRIARALVVVCLAFAAPLRAQDRAAAVVAVVVGANSTIVSLDADSLRDLFLRRRTLAVAGAQAVPVNLPVGDAVRERFSTLVLGRRPAELSGYWDRLYYEGVRPPIVLPSAEAVRRYLQVNALAIGYLDPQQVEAGVRVIALFPPEPSRTASPRSR